jgi:hypothetical protein
MVQGTRLSVYWGSGHVNYLTSYNNHHKIKPFWALEAPFWGQNGIAKSKKSVSFLVFYLIFNYLLWPDPLFLLGRILSINPLFRRRQNERKNDEDWAFGMFMVPALAAIQ